MDFDFDWFANKRHVINMAISALIFGGLGSLIVWFASPSETVFLSKPVIAGGFAPVIGAILQRTVKRSPQGDLE